MSKRKREEKKKIEKKSKKRKVDDDEKSKTSNCDVACVCQKCSKIFECTICKKPLLESGLVECESCKVERTCNKCYNIKHSCKYKFTKSEIVPDNQTLHDFKIKEKFVRYCGEEGCEHKMVVCVSGFYWNKSIWSCNKHSKKCVHCKRFKLICNFSSGYTEKIVDHTNIVYVKKEKYTRISRKIVNEPQEDLEIKIRENTYDKKNVCFECVNRGNERNFKMNISYI